MIDHICYLSSFEACVMTALHTNTRIDIYMRTFKQESSTCAARRGVSPLPSPPHFLPFDLYESQNGCLSWTSSINRSFGVLHSVSVDEFLTRTLHALQNRPTKVRLTSLENSTCKTLFTAWSEDHRAHCNQLLRTLPQKLFDRDDINFWKFCRLHSI